MTTETIDQSATTRSLSLVKHAHIVALCSIWSKPPLAPAATRSTHYRNGLLLSIQRWRPGQPWTARTEFTLHDDYNALLSNDDVRR